MKRSSPHGFTLLEILTVIVIILIIAGWIILTFGPANKKAARQRAQAEIKAIETGCKAYQQEYGDYPRSDIYTEPTATGASPIDPKKDGNAATDAYRKSTAFLYIALSGDLNQDYKIDGDEPTRAFMPFPPGMLNFTKDTAGKIKKVNFIQDPFGNSYGYSTAGAKIEADYKADIALNGNKAQRMVNSAGYNSTFDLWSTGGWTPAGTLKDEDRNKWEKNW